MTLALLSPVNASTGNGGPFDYPQPGNAWFDYTLPGTYTPGDDITVSVDALVYNGSTSSFTPDPDHCFVEVWGAQYNDGSISGLPLNPTAPPNTLIPGDTAVTFLRPDMGASADDPPRVSVTSINTTTGITFIVPGTNESSIIVPGFCGWIIGDAGFPPAGPLPPGTVGEGVIYPDNSSESRASEFALGAAAYTSSSTLPAYQIISGSKVLNPGDVVSILFNCSAFNIGGPNPIAQIGITGVTVTTTGSVSEDIPLTSFRVGYAAGRTFPPPPHAVMSPEYVVNHTYPDGAVFPGFVPLYDASFSNLYLDDITITPPPIASGTHATYLRIWGNWH